MTAQNESARYIVNAVRTLDNLGREIEMLQDLLVRELASVESAIQFRGDLEDTKTDKYSGGDDWLYTGWRWTYPGHKKARGSARLGSLSVVVDIGGEGKIARATDQPVVIIAWAGAGYDWDELDEAFWPLPKEGHRIVNERLVVWESPESAGAGACDVNGVWLYFVPLLAISDVRELRRLIIEPVQRLLRGDAPLSVFSGLPELLRLTWSGDELSVRAVGKEGHRSPAANRGPARRKR